MPIYRTTGTLTGTIEPENVPLAQEYLTEDDMTQYLDEPLSDVVEHVEWRLDGNGHDYSVMAFATRQLNDDELKQLASWTSGQNSDGLGEGFEQQDFAELRSDGDEVCGYCDGSGFLEDEDFEDCENCDGLGWVETEEYGMVSFDWKTNDSTFIRVK